MSILHHQAWPEEKPEIKEGRMVGENRQQAINQMQDERFSRIERAEMLAAQEATRRQEQSWERQSRQKEAEKKEKELKDIGRHAQAYAFAQARYREHSNFYKLMHRKITSKRAEKMTTEQLNALYPSKNPDVYPIYYQAEQGMKKAR